MSNSLRTIIFVLFSLVLCNGDARAATLGFHGDVKGPDGKPIKGAEVSLESKNAKTSAIKTDQQGRFVFRDLATGAYTLTVRANGMLTAMVQDVKTRPDGAVRVDFEMKKQTGVAQAVVPAKVTKKKVFVKELGSNLGRWVDEDEAAAAGSLNVTKGKPNVTSHGNTGGTGITGNP